MEIYTVDELFRTWKPMELAGKKLRVRALGDYELQIRNRMALLARIKAENKLKDKNSDEYQVVLKSLEDETDGVLRSTLTEMWKWESWQKAYQEVQPKYFPFPDDPKPDEEAEVIARREAEPERVRKEREEFVKKRVEENQKAFTEADHARLLSETTRLTILAYGQNEGDAELVHRTLLMCVQREDGQPYFKDLAQVQQLPGSVITELMKAFSEVNNLDPLKLNGASSTASTTE